MATPNQWRRRFWNWFFFCLAFESFINSASYVSFPSDTLAGWTVLYSLVVPFTATIMFATIGTAQSRGAAYPEASTHRPRSLYETAKAASWGIARFLVLFGLYVFFTWLSLTIPVAEPRRPELGPKMDPDSREHWVIFCLLAAPVCAIVAGYWPLVFGKGNSPKDSAYVLPPPIIEE